MSAATKASVSSLFAEQDNVVVSNFDPDDPPGADVDVVIVPSGTTLTADPGGSVVIFQGQASGTFTASQDGGRAFIAQSDDGQDLNFDGQGEVTVETGAGTDSFDVSSDVAVTVDAGGGFDDLNLGENRGDVEFAVDEDGNLVITGSSYTVENMETIQFGDALSVVAEDEDQAIVGRMYQVLFDREADQEGLKYWFDTLESESFDDDTHDMWDVTHAFMNSEEFTEKYGELDNEEFVTQLYLGMNDRAPDEEGLNYWTDVLENPEEMIAGWDGEDDNAKVHVVYAFAYSDEAEKAMGLEGSKYIVPTFDDDDDAS
ncbi:MAG: DUF4214 domain-containing protein [Desulfohalobiaceae bacterium]|nr:DUF4214 domain-containing protein [Desulfohalobiaceae bacterium]